MVTKSRKSQNPPSKIFGLFSAPGWLRSAWLHSHSVVLYFMTSYRHTNLPGHFDINRIIMSFFRPVSDTHSELASSFNLESVYVRYMRRYILS